MVTVGNVSLERRIQSQKEIDVTTTYMTTNDIAELLRTSPETVRYWRHIGTGPKSFKVGRRVLYDSADVTAWLTERKENA